MAPTRTNSTQHRPAPALRRAHFRDDTNLVGLRYEKTAAAEPPVPIMTYSSMSRSSSVRSASVRPVQRSLSASTSCTSLYSPVVVVPPRGSLLEPPAEEHPALRAEPLEPAPFTATKRALLDGWKRDSGHGSSSNASSSASIPEEEPGSDQGSVSVAGRDKDGDIAMTGNSHTTANTTDEPSRGRSRRHGLASPPASEPASPTTPRRMASITSSVASPASPPPLALPSSPSSLHQKQQLQHEETAQEEAEQDQISSPRKLTKKTPSKKFSFWRHSSPPMPYYQTMPPLRGPQPATAAEVGEEPPVTPTKTRPTTLWPSPPYSFTGAASSGLDSPDHHIYSSPSSSGFSPLGISIPDHNLADDDLFTNLSFSHRGSIMGFGGVMGLDPQVELLPAARIAPAVDDDVFTNTTQATTSAASDAHSFSILSQDDAASAHAAGTGAGTAAGTAAAAGRFPVTPVRNASQRHVTSPNVRVLTVDAQLESEKVRSLYDAFGDASSMGDDATQQSFGQGLDPAMPEDDEHVPYDPFFFFSFALSFSLLIFEIVTVILAVAIYLLLTF